MVRDQRLPKARTQGVPVQCWLVKVAGEAPFNVWSEYREVLPSGVVAFYNRAVNTSGTGEPFTWEHVYAFSAVTWSVTLVEKPTESLVLGSK